MRTYTKTSVEERFKTFIRKTDSCWLWTGALDSRGYGNIYSGQSAPKTIQAHRMSWMIHCGPIPPGLCVCHRCDHPACVNPEHLFLGTQLQNMQDCKAKGRTDKIKRAKGEYHGNAVLTNDIVLALRATFAQGGYTIKDAGLLYGLKRWAAWRIIRRKAWTHI